VKKLEKPSTVTVNGLNSDDAYAGDYDWIEVNLDGTIYEL
jgi:hypothetical protein